METIVIKVANSEEVALLKAFLKAHPLKSYWLTKENEEDLVLGKLMEETDYSDTIDTNDFLNELRA